MTLSEILERFEELPPRVQVAVISHLQGFRSRSRIRFTEYEMPVAEYIASTGFIDVSISSTGSVVFVATDVTRTMHANVGRLLTLAGRLEAETAS